MRPVLAIAADAEKDGRSRIELYDGFAPQFSLFRHAVGGPKVIIRYAGRWPVLTTGEAAELLIGSLSGAKDQAKLAATFRRRIIPPTSVKPPVSSAHDAGSGTLEIAGAAPRYKPVTTGSTPAG